MATLASPMDFLTHRLSKAISPPPRTSTSCFWQRKPKKERKDTVKAKNNQKWNKCISGRFERQEHIEQNVPFFAVAAEGGAGSTHHLGSLLPWEEE